MRTALRGLGLVALMVSGTIGCEARHKANYNANDSLNEEGGDEDLVSFVGSPSCPSEDPRCPKLPSAERLGDSPAEALWEPLGEVQGSFLGHMTLTAPAGGTLEVPIEARGRGVDSQWDLFFFDRQHILSESGVLGLRGGAARFLRDVGPDHEIVAEIVSLEAGMFGTTGWSLERNRVTGSLRGRGFLRVPSAGGDLPPLGYMFTLEPAVLEPCTSTDACEQGEVCDALTGFCSSGMFEPGRFQVVREMAARQRSVDSWFAGPVVPADTSMAQVWCSSPALGFSGTWTFPAEVMPARPVMSRSGDLTCMDPRGNARARGPIPLFNRADLESMGVLSAGRSSDDLFELCWNELGRRAPGNFDRNAGATATDYSFYGGGFLDYVPECVSLGHIAGVMQKVDQQTRSDDVQQVAEGRRVLARLLQQWVQLHGFIARQGLTLNGAERQLTGSAMRTPPGLAELLDRTGSGWALVTAALAYGSQASVEARDPDYRRPLRFTQCSASSPCADPALRCETSQEVCHGGICRPQYCVLKDVPGATPDDQGSGLVPALIEGLTAELAVLDAYLRLQAENEGPLALSARSRFGSVMRRALLVESLATKLHGAAQECPAGQTCEAPRWEPRWQQALANLGAARQRLQRLAVDLMIAR